MKLNNLVIQSVAIKSTKPTIQIDNSTKKVTHREAVIKNLITAKAIEWKHTQFKVEVDNKLLDVICPGYTPEIIFSNALNTYWGPNKPSTTANKESIEDLDIYWDYLFEGLEIQGKVVNDKFVIHNETLNKNVHKIYNQYIKEQLKEAKLNKKYK